MPVAVGPARRQRLAHAPERVAVRRRRRGAARRRSRTWLRPERGGSERAEPKSRVQRPHQPGRAAARARPALARWRAAPGVLGERAHGPRARRAQPSATACGAQASSSSSSHSRAGRRRSAAGSTKLGLHAVARGEEAVLVEHLGRVDERRGSRSPPCASSRTRHCTSATSAAVSRDAASARPSRAPRASRSAAAAARPTTGRSARGTRRSAAAGRWPRRSRRSRGTRAGCPTRGNAWNSGVRAEASPVSRPCQNGELRRQREQQRAGGRACGSARAPPSRRSARRRARAARRSARGARARASSRRATGSARRRRPRCPSTRRERMRARDRGARARAARASAASAARSAASSAAAPRDAAVRARWRARAPSRASRRRVRRRSSSGSAASTSSMREASAQSARLEEHHLLLDADRPRRLAAAASLQSRPVPGAAHAARTSGSRSRTLAASSTSARKSARCSGISTSVSACHCTPSSRCRSLSSSMRLDDAVGRPRHGAQALAEPVGRLVVEGVDRRLARRPRCARAASPARSDLVGRSARREPAWRCSIEPSVTSGRCWCSVPPRATLSACAPRQMPEHRHAARVGGRASASSKASRSGSVGPSSGCAPARRSRPGSRSGPPDRQTPARWSSSGVDRRRGRAAAGRPGRPPASSTARR